MGRIRTKDIKDLSRDLFAAYGDRFSPDFGDNKTTMAELKITEGKSKRFRNKVAGYIVRLVRQAEYGHHAPGERAPEAEIAEAETPEAAETQEASEQQETEETAESKETAEVAKTEPATAESEEKKTE